MLWWWSGRQQVEVERWLSTREGGCRRTLRCRACVLQVDTSVIDVPQQQWPYVGVVVVAVVDVVMSLARRCSRCCHVPSKVCSGGRKCQ